MVRYAPLIAPMGRYTVSSEIVPRDFLQLEEPGDAASYPTWVEFWKYVVRYPVPTRREEVTHSEGAPTSTICLQQYTALLTDTSPRLLRGTLRLIPGTKGWQQRW